MRPELEEADAYHLNAEQQTLFNRALLVLAGVGIGWLLFSDKQGYLAKVFSEALGAAGTFLVLDWWIRRRDERQQTQELKHRLICEDVDVRRFTDSNHLDFWEPRRLIKKAIVPEK